MLFNKEIIVVSYFVTLTLSPIFIFAQHGIVLKDTLIIHPLKVGTSVIGATYQGDLNKTWEKFNLGFNLNLQFEKRKKIMPQINLTSGTVTGQDPKFNSKKDKYNSFVRTSFTGLDLRLLYRFTPKQKGTFYLGLGSGILFFNPKDINDRSLLEDKTSRAENETYSNVSFILPSLVGYRYYINPYTNLYFEAVSFNPQTKYLDNINRLGSHKKNDRLFSLNLGVQLSPSQWIQKSYKKPISVPSDELRKGMIAIQKSENELSTLENNHLSIIPIKLIGVTGIKGGIQLQYDEKVSLDEENYQKLQKIGVKLKEAPAKNAYITIEVSGNQDKELIKAQAEAIYLYLKSIILQSGINPQRVYVLYQTKMIKNPSFRIDKITLQIR